MSIFFGMLKTGSIAMEYETAIPSELVLVIQSIIILFIAGEKGFANILRRIYAKEGQDRMYREIFNITLLQNTIRTATPLF